MDSTNSPQSDTPKSDPVNTVPVTPTEVPVVASDVPTGTAPAAPAVQESEATLNLPKPGSHHFPRPFVVGLIILFVLIIVGIIGNYFLIVKYASDTASQANPTTTYTSEATVSPTPINDQEEVDKVDTTFPESDLKTIETDLKGL